MNTDDLEALQRQIIVHSYIYYELNYNVISNKRFDGLCNQVVKVMQENKELKTFYSNAFQGFDGTTGFDLYYRLDEKHQDYISRIASNVVRLYKMEGIK